MEDILKNFIYIILSFFIWSTYGIILNKFNINPIAFTLMTTSIGFVLLSLYICKIKLNLSLDKKLLPVISLTTLLFLTNATTFFYAYQLTSISNAIFSHYLAPIFVFIFSIIILREKLEVITCISLLLAILGLIFIFFPNKNISIHQRDIYGISLGLISAICYGLSVVIAKSVIIKINYLVFMFYQGLFTFILFLLFLFLKTNLFYFNINSIFILIIIGITHSFVAPIMYLKALEKIKAQFAGLLGYTEVVGSILLGIFFLKEIPSLSTLIGGILIVFSGGLVIFYGSNNPKKQTDF